MSWIWLVWLVVIGATFAALEAYALRTNRTTLSMFTWRASQQWPPLPFILGLVAGGLAVHFWWHWCPPGSISGG